MMIGLCGLRDMGNDEGNGMVEALPAMTFTHVLHNTVSHTSHFPS